MKVIDLFCGAGGFSHGFQLEGFDIVLGVDNWKGCQETYEFNHPNTEFLLMDINDLVPVTLPKADVILGSPPCPDFSVQNIRGNPEQGMVCVNRFLEMIEIVKPRYWIMENVPEVAEHLSKGISGHILNSANYGVPQTRRRYFGGRYPLPQPTHSKSKAGVKALNGCLIQPWVTVQDVLIEDGHNSLFQRAWHEGDNGNSEPSPEQIKEAKEKGIAKWKMMADQTGFGESAYKFKSERRRLDPSRPAWTLTSKGAASRPLHPYLNRSINNKERAILMSFPDDFQFLGENREIRQMIGNAVPPEMSRILARAIREDYEESVRV